MRYCKRAGCGRPFITDNAQHEYCSVQCVKAEEKRRERERHQFLDRRVKEEFERAVSVAKSRYPDATPEELFGELRKSETDVTLGLAVEVRLKYTSSYEESLCERGSRVWQSLMDEAGFGKKASRGPA